jgi:TIR domain
VAANAPTAFFSYSREDLEFALRLAKDLKKAGANVWMDKLDIRPGQLWERKAEEALENCTRLLVILSPASVNSRNVMAEVAFALDEQKEVIPVVYRECRVPFRLRPFQYVDFRADYSQGLEELLATVAADHLPEAAQAPAPPLGEESGAVSAADDRATALKLRELRTLTGHTSSVTAMAVTPDGQRAVSASGGKMLKVWELASGRELSTLGVF